jgi:tetratricopeptide (TPR) repeat protein
MTPRILIVAALLMAAWSPAPAVEQSVDDVLKRATDGLSQFSLDWPQKLFEQVRARAERGSPQWQQATYGLATCRQFQSLDSGLTASAEALYRELVEVAPTSIFAPRALLNLGRIAELPDYHQDPIRLDEARKRYQEVIAGWKDQPIAGEATMRLASTYAQTGTAGDAAQGLALLRSWLDAHPADPLAPAMWQWMGDVHFIFLQQPSEALDCYLKADALGILWNSREGILWWRMARLAERVGRRDVAVTYFTKICTDAQTSGRAFEAQLALGRLGVKPPELTAFAAYQGEKPVIPVATEPAP